MKQDVEHMLDPILDKTVEDESKHVHCLVTGQTDCEEPLPLCLDHDVYLWNLESFPLSPPGDLDEFITEEIV